MSSAQQIVVVIAASGAVALMARWIYSHSRMNATKDESPSFEGSEELARARDEFHRICVDWINTNGIPTEGNGLLAGLLLSRGAELFAALSFLAYKGHNAGAAIILRSMYECVVYSRACMWDKNCMNEYLALSEVQRKKNYNRIKESKSPIIKQLASEIDPESIENVEAVLKKLKATGTWSLEAFARVAQMHDWYLLLYCYHSVDTHITSDSLQKGILSDEKGEIQGFSLGVGFEDSKRNISVAGVFLARVFREAQVAYFGEENGLPQEWEDRWTKLAGLSLEDSPEE